MVGCGSLECVAEGTEEETAAEQVEAETAEEAVAAATAVGAKAAVAVAMAAETVAAETVEGRLVEQMGEEAYEKTLAALDEAKVMIADTRTMMEKLPVAGPEEAKLLAKHESRIRATLGQDEPGPE